MWCAWLGPVRRDVRAGSDVLNRNPIITCAVTGSGDTAGKHPDLPKSPAEIAAAAIEEIGVYNHWQKSMLTEDPDQAEQYARNRGLETEWGPNRLLKTRYCVSAFEYDPPLDRVGGIDGKW